MGRIYFKNKIDCTKFFEECKKQLQIKSWRRLAQIIKTNRSMLDSYRKRELCMPEDKFLILLKCLDSTKKAYFLRVIEKRSSNWGQIIGGKKAYEINKKQFEIGRRKAASIKKHYLKYNFDINIPLSEDLCEFIGAIIGDGFTNKYGTSYQTQITGDSKLDGDYYYSRLKPVCEKLFRIPPTIRIKDTVIRLNIYSKRLFEMLTKRFKIPAGKKSYSVVIPPEIYNANKSLLNSTLKGMFNTDGGIGFDKRKSYKKPYIRVNYTSSSKKLIKQISKTLLDYSIKHSIHKKSNSFMIQINGPKNVYKFMSKIGFSNKRHLNKIKDI